MSMKLSVRDVEQLVACDTKFGKMEPPKTVCRHPGIFLGNGIFVNSAVSELHNMVLPSALPRSPNIFSRNECFEGIS
jgi:hypothetical protein